MIEEGAGDIIQLKRTQNLLLNISTHVPPEILGHIFHWNVIPARNFDRLQKGSYNFLLVCHHWFEVTSHTPSLWRFWGNTLKQWSQQYQRSGITPLDLVLNDVPDLDDTNLITDVIPLGKPLEDALRDRAARNSIRSVHLRSRTTDLLRSIISSLFPTDGEGIQYSSIESLILEDPNLDITNFLTQYHFPKLQHLDLSARARTSTWDHLKLHTTLTTL